MNPSPFALPRTARLPYSGNDKIVVHMWFIHRDEPHALIERLGGKIDIVPAVSIAFTEFNYAEFKSEGVPMFDPTPTPNYPPGDVRRVTRDQAERCIIPASEFVG